MSRIAIFLFNCDIEFDVTCSQLISNQFDFLTVNSLRMHHYLDKQLVPHNNFTYLEDNFHYLIKKIRKLSKTKEVVVITEKFQSSLLKAECVSCTRSIAIMFEQVALLMDSSDITSLFNGCDQNSSFVASTLSFRKYLSAKVFEHSSLFDFRIAESIRVGGKLRPERNVLVIGSGAREHAIVHHLLSSSDSDSVIRVFVAPGNAGTASEEPSRCSNVPISSHDIAKLVSFAQENSITLVIIGPEQPLVDGITDAMLDLSIPCFGPSQRASQIESSKAFSKGFMSRHGIGTPDFRVFTDFAVAEEYLVSITHRVVVKASGLAAGKGVLLPSTSQEAVRVVRDMLVDDCFGEAGREVVVEQFVDGTEVSVLAFCDGVTALGMPPAQDHKRVRDGDEGPNTGGMGAFAPTSAISAAQYAQCVEVLQRTVAALAAEGMPFVGVLYGGFIFPRYCDDQISEPLLLEYNCRFGDPEAQVLLPLLESDLYSLCLACVEQRLSPTLVHWAPPSTHVVTVVCASRGYPSDEMLLDQRVCGLEQANSLQSVRVYHGATRADERSGFLTGGGRVLSVTGRGSSLQEAVTRAYQGVESVHFEGMHFRKDIARKQLECSSLDMNAGEWKMEMSKAIPIFPKPLRIGVLGSTKGTSLAPLLEAVESGELADAEVVVVISNREGAGILDKARSRDIEARYISASRLTREQFDCEVTAALVALNVHLVLLIGYMRIVSARFVDDWRGRVLNVHPSLLPAFAGRMDAAVHEEVLKAGVAVSGCTVHQVTEQVDGGDIVVQLTCTVDRPRETVQSLRDKVQRLEGQALIQAVDILRAEEQLTHGIKSVAAAGPLHRQITYKDAGVDIDLGETLVQRIKPLVRATRRAGAETAELGGFGGMFDLSQCARYKDCSDVILVSGTDGVGTKLLLAQQLGDHSGIGIDLVAMCVNDVLVCGAEPLFFLDYFATGRLDLDVAAAVVESIAQGCIQAGCALIGGETAEMSGMYTSRVDEGSSAGLGGAGEYDLAGFSVGAVRRGEVLPRDVSEGDVVFGLPSSGLHSNGFSLVRKCVEVSGFRLSDLAPFDTGSGSSDCSLGEFLLRPTTIYVSQLLPLVQRGLIKGLAHITGGGVLDNIPRVLPEHLAVAIDVESSGWRLPGVFQWLQSIARLSQDQLLRTFNCGVGMVVIVAACDAEVVWTELTAHDAPLMRLGSVVSRNNDVNGAQVIISGQLV